MDDRTPTFRASVIYQDDRAALQWLHKAFGFEVSMVISDDAGKIVHAEMKYRDGFVIVDREWSAATQSPRSLGGKNTQQLHVQLDADIDAHCERARAAGAIIVAEPADQFYGDRTYRAMDPEGHIWMFAQTVKPMTPSEMEKASGHLKVKDRL